LNAWLAYFARDNRVWVANPQINDITPERVPAAANTLFPKGFPKELLVLGSNVDGLQASPPRAATLLWSNPSYQLWQTRSDHWAVPLRLANPNGIEPGQPFFWIGPQPATLDVMAGCPGTLLLRGKLCLGPDGLKSHLPQLSVSTRTGYKSTLAAAGGEASVCVPIPFGRSTIVLTAPDPPCRAQSAGGDQRILLVGVQGLRVQFRPDKPTAQFP
jgi:hypothetical protein